MRRYAFERGRCLSCLKTGHECWGFESATLPDALPGDSDRDPYWRPSGESPDEYRADPLPEALTERLYETSRPLPEDYLFPPDSLPCSSCSCPFSDHEVVRMAERERKALAVAQRIFAPISLEIGMRQSVQDTVSLRWLRDELTYGETGFLPFFRVLDRIQEVCDVRGGCFYDLGTGTGKPLVLAAMHSIRFQKCAGVELLPGLCALAKGLRFRYEAERDNIACTIGWEPAPLDVHEGNLYDFSVEGASVILVNASCVKPNVVDKLRAYLTRVVPVGCVVVSIRHAVAGPGADDFEPVTGESGEQELSLAMSWGNASVHLAVRRRMTTGGMAVSIDLHAMD
eukprot:TRINITY_DN7057_c0_g1_i1.p1 TRINITY_DN7057_c0_g1~~TRINITY_DN7057_c0_g1_i1.p1  ORF type:complete len:341 (+),score=44.07 TRINITY_DN7057_c0_g1_i1:100-1122(+)